MGAPDPTDGADGTEFGAAGVIAKLFYKRSGAFPEATRGSSFLRFLLSRPLQHAAGAGEIVQLIRGSDDGGARAFYV